MPLATQTDRLARGFDILFDSERAPQTTVESAKTWARAYTDYAVFGGIPAARAKEIVFAAALAQAFNPELAGGGPPLFITALEIFWLGLPVPAQGGIVVAAKGSSSVNSPQPPDASPRQQADSLAQVIATFTLGAVKIQVGPPGPIVPIA